MAGELNKVLWITAGGILGTIATLYTISRVQEERQLNREYDDIQSRANARAAKLREAAARATKAQVRITITHGFGGNDEIIPLNATELAELKTIIPHIESAPLPDRSVWKSHRHGLGNRVKSPSFYRYLANLEFLDEKGHLLDEVMLNEPIVKTENAGNYRRTGCSATYMLPTEALHRFESLPGIITARTYKPN